MICATFLFPYDDTNNQFIMYKKNNLEHNNALLEELKHFTESIQQSTSPTINGNVATKALDIALIIQEKINDNK